MSIADALTLLRLILVPVFVWLFARGFTGWALTVFCSAGATDLIDGTIARWFHQSTRLGSILDPVADKLLLQATFACLLITGHLPWWFFVVALVRDFMIMMGIFYLEWVKANVAYRPTWPSKFATLFQLITATLGLIMAWREGSPLLATFFHVAMAVTFFLILISSAQYLSVGLGIIRGRRRASSAK